MTRDRAQLEDETYGNDNHIYRLSRSDSDLIITAAPREIMEPHLEKIQNEGFHFSGDWIQQSPLVRVRSLIRHIPRPMDAGLLIQRLQKHDVKAPVTLCLISKQDGFTLEVPLDGIYEKQGGRLQLRGMLPDAS